METFNITAGVLKAAALCAPAKEDRRGYLNGVHIGRTFDGRIAVTGTDGHVLFRYVLGERVSKAFPEEGVIIPINTVRGIKASKSQLGLPVLVAIDGSDSVMAFQATGARLMFTPLAGQYPSTVGLWPEDVDPGLPAIYVDPALVKRAVDALSFTNADWAFRYSKECMFLSSKNRVAHAIVMGMRRNNEYSRPIF